MQPSISIKRRTSAPRLAIAGILLLALSTACRPSERGNNITAPTDAKPSQPITVAAKRNGSSNEHTAAAQTNNTGGGAADAMSIKVLLPPDWIEDDSGQLSAKLGEDVVTAPQLRAVVPGTGGRSAALTIMQLAREGLTPADYVSMVSSELDAMDSTLVERAGILYAERRDGAPVGAIRYSFVPAEQADTQRLEGAQFVLLSENGAELIVFTLVAEARSFATHLEEIERLVRDQLLTME